MIDVKALAVTLLDEVREWVSPALEKIRERLDAQDAAIKAIPPAKEIDLALIESAVAKAISALPKPKDGEDAVVDYDRIGLAIKEAVAVAVSEIPKPRDGKDVDMDALQKDIDARFAALMTSAESRIDVRLETAVKAIPDPKEPVVDYDRIGTVIKETVATAVSEIPKPQDGKDADEESITQRVSAYVKELFSSLPKPEDGKSVTVEEVLSAIRPDLESVARDSAQKAVDSLPRPKDGEDADEDAITGRVIARATELISALPKPKDGESVSLEQVVTEMLPLVEDQIRDHAIKAVSEIPKPQDGKSITIEDVRPLLDAALAGAALDFEKRAQDVLQRTIESGQQRIERAIEEIPTPKDGRDAFDLEDLEITQSEDGREVTFSFRRGDLVREKTFRIPGFVDRGVFRMEEIYTKGDGVTFGGSFWLAQKNNPGKPGEGDGWRLAVKRGRDAK